jgi:CAAX protease family protein
VRAHALPTMRLEVADARDSVTENADKAGAKLAPIPKPWGVWASLAIVIAAEAARHQYLWINTFQGTLLTVSQWSIPFVFVVVAAVFTRVPLADYLAWSRPRVIPIVAGMGAVAATSLFFTVTDAYLAGYDPLGFIARHRAAIARGVSNWDYVLNFWPIIALAPIVEETVYRGFLWRGLAASRPGLVGALLVTSLCFAAIHYKYFYGFSGHFNAFVLASYFVSGLIYGCVRWRSESTIAAMIVSFFANVWIYGLNAIVLGPFAS